MPSWDTQSGSLYLYPKAISVKNPRTTVSTHLCPFSDDGFKILLIHMNAGVFAQEFSSVHTVVPAKTSMGIWEMMFHLQQIVIRVFKIVAILYRDCVSYLR